MALLGNKLEHHSLNINAVMANEIGTTIVTGKGCVHTHVKEDGMKACTIAIAKEKQNHRK